MPGWLKMYRKITEWEWYTDSQTVHLFIHIIIKASFEDSKWRGQNIKRGQLFTGRKLLSQQTGISEQSIRTILNRLKSTKEITIESTSKNSIITVCNYEGYQAEYQQTNQQINQQTNQQSTSDQPAINHIKEVKKLKKEKEKNLKTVSLPAWIPKETWGDFVEMRKEIKSPLTDRAIKIAFMKLKTLEENGSSPKLVLEQSIMNGWKGLFEVKQIVTEYNPKMLGDRFVR